MSDFIFKIGDPYMEGITAKKRADIMDTLDSVCYGQEEANYSRALTPEELANSKSKLSESVIKLSKIEEEKKEVMDDFKERIKAEKAIKDEFLSQVRFGSVNVDGRVFKVDNQEEGVMYSFDERGICVGIRPLLPEERQGKIRMMNKASNE